MSVWLTILALYILNNKFKNKEDEWKMIARKSTIYLKQQGLEKVASIISKIKIPFKT